MGHSLVRNLVIILGDQLDLTSSALDDFDHQQDRIWMAEAAEESTHVWSHQARIALFLSAMRHFADELRRRGFPVEYTPLTENISDHSDTHGISGTSGTSRNSNRTSLAGILENSINKHRPNKLILAEPGDWRVEQSIREVARRQKVEVEIREDRHFFATRGDFRDYAEGRKQLRLEYFYRHLRRQTGILMAGSEPVGGSWNFDQENRETFPKRGARRGPGNLSPPRGFPPDSITKDVLRLVSRRFDSHPGKVDHFDWPVTREQALQALNDFCQNRLRNFGRFQDAMWQGEPYLFHSRLSAAMNLKLIGPREVIDRVLVEYDQQALPLPSVEGFVRQILGWREYVRGVYWLWMPEYAEMNELNARHDLPPFYWTAETDMNCLRCTVQQTLDHGYAHHIQRLMITGLFALLLGVQPQQVHAWYLAVYVDAVEWVELPNTLGMSQYADGGRLASKPYAATGKYIDRMSNYCQGCRFDPGEATDPDACPFTTLYWDFLDRNRTDLEANQRMTFQMKNLARKGTKERQELAARAEQFRNLPGIGC